MNCKNKIISIFKYSGLALSPNWIYKSSHTKRHHLSILFSYWNSIWSHDRIGISIQIQIKNRLKNKIFCNFSNHVTLHLDTFYFLGLSPPPTPLHLYNLFWHKSPLCRLYFMNWKLCQVCCCFCNDTKSDPMTWPSIHNKPRSCQKYKRWKGLWKDKCSIFSYISIKSPWESGKIFIMISQIIIRKLNTVGCLSLRTKNNWSRDDGS